MRQDMRCWLLACACWAPSAWAAPPTETVDDLHPLLDMSLQELSDEIVTARRRPEPLQHVPIAVTQIGSQSLQDHRIQRVGDLQGWVPNLLAHEGDASNAVVYLRGIGQQDSLFFAEAGVGLYLDDVYLGGPQAAQVRLFDLERVEVLRGPQGTLYGKNTIGGAIKYITRAPTAEPEAQVSLGWGQHMTRTLDATVGGALVEDRLLGRLAVATTRDQGLSHNSWTGGPDHDTRSLDWRLGLKWLLDQDASLQFTLDGRHSDPRASRTPRLATPMTDGEGQTYPALADPDRVSADYTQRNLIDSLGWTAVWQRPLSPHWGLKSITAWRQLDFDTRTDLDASPVPVVNVWYRLQQEQISQELQLAYRDSGLQAVAGVYLYQDRNRAFDGADMRAYLPNAYGFGGTASQYTQNTHSHALYVEMSYQWAPTWSATLGLRYTQERKTFTRDFELFSAQALPSPESGRPFQSGDLPGGTGPFQMRQTWASWSPRLGLNHQWSADVLTFASVSSGFKSGGFDGRAQFLPGAFNQPYRPEGLTAYEMGIKSRWLNNRLQLNASVFHNRYRDIQLNALRGNNGLFQYVFTNAADGHTQGVEVEGVYKPTERWALRGALGYLHTGWTNRLDPARDVDAQPSFVYPLRWNLTLGTSYTHTLPDWGFVRWGANVHLRQAAEQRPSLYPAQIHTLSGFVQWESLDRKWLVNLSGHNLTNRVYAEQVFDFTLKTVNGYKIQYLAEPRTVQANLTYRF